MKYASAEDRLNPDVPPDTPDDTLGGYLRVHGRAVAFEGADGEPYTVAADADPTDDPARPWAGYLVFLRWARTGSAIMGHATSDDLAFAPTAEEARAAVEALPLATVRRLLDETVRRASAADDDDADGPPHGDDAGAAPHP